MEKKFGVNLYTFTVVVGFWLVGSVVLKTATVLLAEKNIPLMDKAAELVHAA